MKAALVTGASSGIGAATARRLDRGGYTLLLVARREERLRALAAELRSAAWLAADLTADGAPAQLAAWVADEWGRLDLLVNNAGAAWRARFGDPDGGYASAQRNMELNFFATVRVTEALHGVLRRSAPSAIVNVCSVSSRIAMRSAGAYSASKFALAGWTETLRFEEAPHGVHVGAVFPGFITTEGFPQADLRERRLTRWMVSADTDKVADAIYAVGPGGRPERSVPRAFGLVGPMRHVTPWLWRLVGPRIRR